MIKNDLFVVCGGKGTRLYPLTKTVPKSLVPVNGKPFAIHQLELFLDQGFRSFVYCIGLHGAQIVELLGDGSQWGAEIRYSDDGETLLGTYGSLQAAVKAMGLSGDDTIPVIYGDSYLEFDAALTIDDHKTSGMDATMTFTAQAYELETPNIFLDGSRLHYDKQRSQNTAAPFIDYGFSVFKAGIFEEDFSDLSHCQNVLSSRNDLNFHFVDSYYFEVGTPQGVSFLESHLAEQIERHPK